MKTKKTLFATMILILFTKFSYGLTSQECTQFIESLPPSYSVNEIEVPINWDNPKGTKTKVFYFTNLKPYQTPVVYFNGGPLGYDHYSYTIFDQKAAERNLGFVYIDQRGTGCSGSIPKVIDVDSAIFASFFAADQIVMDAEAIREKILGPSPWKIFGQSYGGQIANRYLDLKGQSIISVHNYAGGFNSNMTDFFANRMLKQHQVAQRFFAQYPQLLTVYNSLKSKLTEKHCITYQSRLICGLVLLDMAMDELYSISNWSNFASRFENLLIDNEPNLDLLKSYASYSLDYFFSDQFLISNLVWNQESGSSSPVFDKKIDCDFAEEIVKSKGFSPDQILVNHCRIIRLAMTPEISEFLGTVNSKIKIRQIQIEPHDFLASLQKHPNVKYYAYSGGLDFYDTVEHIYRTIDAKNQFQHLHFENQDHYGYFVESIFWDYLARP